MVTKVAVTNHPRAYRVRRIEPGIDWSSWTNTYHPTIEAARAAASGYLRGSIPRYRSYGHRGVKSRYVVIGERMEFRGRASYNNIERIVWGEGSGKTETRPI